MDRVGVGGRRVGSGAVGTSTSSGVGALEPASQTLGRATFRVKPPIRPARLTNNRSRSDQLVARDRSLVPKDHQ